MTAEEQRIAVSKLKYESEMYQSLRRLLVNPDFVKVIKQYYMVDSCVASVESYVKTGDSTGIEAAKATVFLKNWLTTQESILGSSHTEFTIYSRDPEGFFDNSVEVNFDGGNVNVTAS